MTMPPIDLVLRGTDRLHDAQAYLDWYDDPANVAYGARYYALACEGARDRIDLHDLGFAALLGGRPSAVAAASLAAHPVSIGDVPDRDLRDLDAAGRRAVVDGIVRLTALPGIGCAVATKMLHKKRPATVPVMDNGAVFGTYLDADWRPGPGRWRTAGSVSRPERIGAALDAIAREVANPESASAWAALERANPGPTRIELFDKLWWAYARLEGKRPGG